MTFWLLKAGKMFINLYIGPQHCYFPLTLWVVFHNLLEILEQAEDYNQPKSQAEETYLIVHTDDSQ